MKFQKLATPIAAAGIAVITQLAFALEAKAYESWELPFSNETFNAPMQRDQGGQQYGDEYCNNRWNEMTSDPWSSLSGYAYSVDNRPIHINQKQHVWYHWNNRQCVVNVPSVQQAWNYYNPFQQSFQELNRPQKSVNESFIDYGVDAVIGGVAGSNPYTAPFAGVIPTVDFLCDIYMCSTPIKAGD